MQEDRKLEVALIALRKNSRMNLVLLKAETGIPKSTMIRKIRKIRKMGRFASLIEFSKIGYPISTLFLFYGNEKARDTAFSSPNTNNLSKLGKNRFIVHAYFKSLAESESFVGILMKNGARSIETYFVSEHIGHEMFMQRNL